MSNLRRNLAFMSGLRCSWTSAELGALSSVPEHRAAAYLATVARLGAVARLSDGSWIAGPKAAEWRKKAAKTAVTGNGSYGNNAVYQAEKKIRDDLRQRDWHAGRSPAQPRVSRQRDRTLTDAITSALMEQMPANPLAIDRMKKVTIVAKNMGVSRYTILQLVVKKKIKGAQINSHYYCDPIEAVQYIENQLSAGIQ